MIVNRFIVYACCVFLTYLSAIEAVTIDEQTRIDFGNASDVADLNLELIVDPDQLLAGLDRLLYGNEFIKIWKHVKKAKKCDDNLIDHLIKMQELADPSENFGSLKISKMMYGHFTRALDICSHHLEMVYKTSNRELIALANDNMKVFRELMKFTSDECKDDKFCLNTSFNPHELEVITKAIHGEMIDQDPRKEINRIKLSLKMLTMTRTCRNPVASDIALIENIMRYSGKLGVYTQNFLLFQFFCREYKNREHLHVNYLVNLNQEPYRITPCYELVDNDPRPRRRDCPDGRWNS